MACRAESVRVGSLGCRSSTGGCWAGCRTAHGSPLIDIAPGRTGGSKATTSLRILISRSTDEGCTLSLTGTREWQGDRVTTAPAGTEVEAPPQFSWALAPAFGVSLP